MEMKSKLSLYFWGLELANDKKVADFNVSKVDVNFF